MNNEKVVISEPRLLSLLHSRKPRVLSFNKDTLSIEGVVSPAIRVVDVSVEQPWIIPKLLGGRVLRITTLGKEGPITSLFNAFESDVDVISEQVKRLVSEELALALSSVGTFSKSLISRCELVYHPCLYVRSSVAKRFSEIELNGFLANVSRVKFISKHVMLSQNERDKASSILAELLSVDDYIRRSELARDRHNQHYFSYWKYEAEEYFRTVESSPLTDEQIQTALVFEDATLVVAAAGSGKSSCIVGKIGFALKTGLFDETQILALSYNKSAAASLQKRLNEKLEKVLGRSVSVASKTFHSYGLATLIAHHGKDYELKVLKEEEREEERFIKEVISKLVRGNNTFQNALALWVSLVPYDEPQLVGSTGDLEECAKRYEECCRERLRARKAPGRKPWEPTIPTWRQDVYVRSLEERGIANWLILHDVQFKYELPDWGGAMRLGLGTYESGKQKPYNPDFTYSYVEELSNGKSRTVRVVHEHFALDANGRAPEWLGGTKYEQYAKNKRAMYRAWMAERPIGRERVVFMETTSAMFRDGSVWSHLERNLKSAGIEVKKPNPEIQNQALEQFREASDLEQLIIDFVLRYKDSGLAESDVLAEAAKSSNPYRSQLFLDVALLVFHAYQQTLNDEKKIDFSDMLREAIIVLSDSRTKSPYRFILVDEFQDISRLKADLVKAILAKNYNESIVFCVGDDWQTINRFSGSDVSIFTNASNYFERVTSRLELTKTFRCSQSIADVAKHLVMRNPSQFNKEVKALPDRVTGAIRVVHHIDNADVRRVALRAELDNIVTIAQDLGLNFPSVQILRRTKHDITVPEGMQTDFLKQLVREYGSTLNIELHTMHGSKGLEADFVIIPGLDSGFRGFPDERPAEPLLDLVLPVLTSTVEEERRLMYVALTRAKHSVSLLVSGRRPSEFIVELESVQQQFPAINWISCSTETRTTCPKCKSGSLIPARGSSGYLLCSRAVACGYAQRMSRRK
ncbi:UvrD-helicase domain-containing protein [Aeromonas veronii]|uniref:UvrD-helicase domain-containing protein n=1 Tax=Aeromonas veronii TaxID=654 RepID=UPI001F477422|nr:UvrD-helicase domain-containing protein [Aeromonas veronii]MCF5895078.1 UvrD-helicase domain-containing protein [Aeromonas veronii]